MFGEAAASSNGGAASAGEVVAVGICDTFDDAELAQTGELSGEGGGRALGEQRPEVGAAQTGGEGAGCRALPMFHLAVVLESGDVVGGGLQAQDEAEFVTAPGDIKI